MLWLIESASGKTMTMNCDRRPAWHTCGIKRAAMNIAERWGEQVHVRRLDKPEFSAYPDPHIPQGAKPRERARLRRTSQLKCDLKTAWIEFERLPKKGSFSGIHLAGEIDRITRELHSLGDTSENRVAEVTIEVG